MDAQFIHGTVTCAKVYIYCTYSLVRELILSGTMANLSGPRDGYEYMTKTDITTP